MIAKYLDIPFERGGRTWDGADCYGLLILFYKWELGKILPDYEYDKYWDGSSDCLQVNIGKFTDPIDKPEKYCFVTFTKIGGEIQNHIGMMLDDVRFLHIPNTKKVRLPLIGRMTDRLWKMRFYGYFKLKENG